MKSKVIAIIGDGKTMDNKKLEIAFNLGKLLSEKGYIVLTGGLGGIMDSALQGAKSSESNMNVKTIAIIPSFDRNDASESADVVIPTGLDVMRNAIVANSDAVIAIGGGAGTLSEIALAWSLFRLVIAFDNVDGWSQKLAGTKIDERKRYDFEDLIFPVSTPEQAMKVLEENITKYNRNHKGIKWR